MVLRTIGDHRISPSMSSPRFNDSFGNTPPSSPSRQITVVDVYDLAASIGRDFELLAEQYGRDSIETLMPKVLSALETLESFASFNEKENAQISDLERTIEGLEKEKQMRIAEKQRLEKDVLDVEESFKKEIDELWSMVRNLQTENKNLKNRLATKNDEPSLDDLAPKNDEELHIVVDLKRLTLKQKDQIKELQQDVEQYTNEVDSLKNNIEKLIRQNKELLRKNGSLQKQGRILIQERNEFAKRVQDAEEENYKLKNDMAVMSRALKDLGDQKNQVRDGDDIPRFTLAELREVLQEKNILKARVMELEEQLDIYRGKSTASESFRDDSDNQSRPCSSTSTTDLQQFIEDQENDGVDISSLAGEISEAEEPDPEPTTSRAVSEAESVKSDKSSLHDSLASEELDLYMKEVECRHVSTQTRIGDHLKDEECVVYGPLPKEPEEKLYPWKYQRKESGVRRFFRFLVDFNSSGLSPRRGSTANHSKETSS